MKQVAIIGGGLAGLICGIELSQKGVQCWLFEKKAYPFHRVCGEYISNEALPYLTSRDLYPEKFNPKKVSQFLISSVRGQFATMPLDMGGFGISRYAFDHFLFEKAREYGVEFFLNSEIIDVRQENDKFELRTNHQTFSADLVIGSFGKRSRMDVQLKRDFVSKRSPYIGVKYHAKTDHPAAVVALHNFRGGYCGIVNVEDGISNICYLVKREVVQQHGSIQAMEAEVLFKNPLLKHLFTNAEFLFEKPVVINEISFATKTPVEHGILMAGDAAGMIAPLCGNGMAIAIHSGKILAELVTNFCRGRISKSAVDAEYSKAWNNTFAKRLSSGRTIQHLFGNDSLSNIAVNLILHSRPISRFIMKKTHGQTF